MLKFIQYENHLYPLTKASLWTDRGVCHLTIEGVDGEFFVDFIFENPTDYTYEYLQGVMSNIMVFLKNMETEVVHANDIHTLVARGFNTVLRVNFTANKPKKSKDSYDTSQYYYGHVFEEEVETLSFIAFKKNKGVRKPKTKMGHRYELDHAFGKSATALTLRGFDRMGVQPDYRGTTEEKLKDIISSYIANYLQFGHNVIDVSTIMMNHAKGMGYLNSAVHEVS